MTSEDNVVQELIREITTLVHEFPQALERRAAAIEATGKDPELVGKLMKGADAMRDSGNLYVTWARHFAGLSEGTSDTADDDDESSAFDI